MLGPVRLAALLGRLSRATDMGAGVPEGSALRTATLAARLAAMLGLSPDHQRDAYYAALLRYLGCTAYSAEAAPLGAGDDLGFLAAFETVDPTDVPALAVAAFRDLARDAWFAARAAAIARVLADPSGYAKLARAHCAQAEALAELAGMPPGVVSALQQSYERFDGKGHPKGLRGDALVPAARVLHGAWTIEVQLRRKGLSGAVHAVKSARGRALDPRVCDAFLDAAPVLLALVTGGDTWERFLEGEPGVAAMVPDDGALRVARAFAKYVDLKSPSTLAHSTGTGALARRAGLAAGFDAPKLEALELAALLHDLGRASVPNGIWDKPGALTTMEREKMERHAEAGAAVVAGWGPFAALAGPVGTHHDRLDGSGYPGRRHAAELDETSRIVAACDVVHALGEDRPHRPRHAWADVVRLARDEATRGRLDAKATEWALLAAGAKPKEAKVERKHPAGLTAREVEVLRYLAMGKTNAEIAKILFVSPKTVKVHVEHVYEKTKVNTRAAAALFAVAHDLVDDEG